MKNLIKLIICILAFVFSFQNLFSGDFSSSRYNTRNIGSVKKLGGNTLIVVIFASQDGQGNVSNTNRDRLSASTDSAIEWIKNECSKYGKQEKYVIATETKELKVKRDIELYCIEPLEAARLLYGNDYENKIKKIADNHGCDNYLIMVATECDSVCLCYSTSERFSSNYLEGCVININVHSNLTSVIAHELLHAYGAWDLYYYDFDSDFSQYKSEMSNSIMLTTFSNINNLKIDRLTAYLIGLSDKKEYWFNDFAQ